MDALKFYGQFRAYTGVIITSLIASSLISSGVLIIRSPSVYTNKTTGTANNVKCDPDKCTTNVSVTVSGNTYTPFLTFSEQITEKSTVDVYYDNSNPPNFSSTGATGNKDIIGYGFIGVALCILLIAVLFAVVVSKSNTAAKVYGGVTAISDVGKLL